MAKDETMNSKTLTEHWIRLLDYGGCSPQNQNLFKKTVNGFFIIFCSFVIILSIMELLISEIKSISDFTRYFIIIVGYMQVTIKFVTCRVKSKTLQKIVDIMWTEFWSLDYATEKTKIKLLYVYKFISLITKIYCFVILGSILSVVCQAEIAEHRTLPLDLWLPKKNEIERTPYFQLFYAFQIVFMISHDMLCVIPLDALFVTMIGLVYCQFNIVKEILLTIGNENTDGHEIIKRCVIHHNLLLRFLEMLESVYSNAILLIIGSGLCLASLNLYAIVMENDNSLKAMFVVLYICIFLQLYFYCQAGQIIQDEVESIGEAAYNCKWYSVPNNVTKGLQLIILRAHRRFNITAGGFMILNLETLATIVQTSFSFLTFLENIKS